MSFWKLQRTSQPQQAVGVTDGSILAAYAMGVGAVDYTGKNAPGVPTNGPTYVGTERGRAYRFTGSGSQWVNCGSPANMRFVNQTSNITFSCLVYKAATGQSYRGILFKQGTATGDFNIGLKTQVTTNQFGFAVGRNNVDETFAVDSAGDVPVGWYVLHGTFSSSGAVRLYVNGQLAGSATYTAGSGAVCNAALAIGNDSGGLASRGFNGSILNAVIRNKVLSAAEVFAEAQNIWRIYAPVDRSIWVPSSASASLPTLSAPTFVSATSSSLTPRVTATWT